MIVSKVGMEYETLVRMSRVGFDCCVGYLDGGYDTWSKEKTDICYGGNIVAKDFETLFL